VLYGLWVSHYVRGNAAATLEQATEFLSLAQSQSSTGPLLIGHRLFGTSLIMSGDHRSSLSHLQTASSLYRPDEHREFGLRFGQDIGISAFVYLSWALWHCGWPAQSVRTGDRALEYCRQLGHAHTLAYALWHTAMVAILARRIAAIEAYSDECVALAHEHGFAQWIAFGPIFKGWVAASKGDVATRIQRIREGLAASEATGAGGFKPIYLGLLAEVLARAGKIHEAIASIDEGLAISAAFGQKGTDAELHRLRSELVWQSPHPDPGQPEGSFRVALAIAREQGTRGYELRAATTLARMLADQRRIAEARDLLAPIYGWFTEGYDMPDLKEAKALLDELA